MVSISGFYYFTTFLNICQQFYSIFDPVFLCNTFVTFFIRFRGRLYVDPLFISISILKKIPVKDKVLPCFAKAFHIFLYDQA